jgi:hypothetical protein
MQIRNFIIICGKNVLTWKIIIYILDKKYAVLITLLSKIFKCKYCKFDSGLNVILLKQKQYATTKIVNLFSVLQTQKRLRNPARLTYV